MSNNPYQSRRESKNTLPGFLMLVGIIIASIWVIQRVAVYLNDLFNPAL